LIPQSCYLRLKIRILLVKLHVERFRIGARSSQVCVETLCVLLQSCYPRLKVGDLPVKLRIFAQYTSLPQLEIMLVCTQSIHFRHLPLELLVFGTQSIA
jgi:hypothetical protein